MLISGNDISYIRKWDQSAQYIHLCDCNHANSLHRSYHGLGKGKGNITRVLALFSVFKYKMEPGFWTTYYVLQDRSGSYC